MRNIFEILLLVLIWCGFSNDFSLPTVIFAIIIASLIVGLTNRYKAIKFGVNIFVLTQLLMLTVYELFKSSIEVALEILNISRNKHPEIITIPLACENNFQKTVLANLISLTPGTLSIDITENNHTLIIHCMFSRDRKKLVKFVKEVMEPKVMRAFYVK